MVIESNYIFKIEEKVFFLVIIFFIGFIMVKNLFIEIVV